MKRKKLFISIMAFIVIVFAIYIVNIISDNLDNFEKEKIADNTEPAFPEKDAGYLMVNKINQTESMINVGTDLNIVPLGVTTIMDNFRLEEIKLIKANSVIEPLENQIQISSIDLNDVHEIKLQYGYFDDVEKYAQNYFFDFYCYDMDIKRDTRQYNEICDDLENNRMFFTEMDYQELVDSSEEGDVKYLFFGNKNDVTGIAAVKEENEHVYIMKAIYQNLSNEYVEKEQYYAPFGSIEDAKSFIKSDVISNLFTELSNIMSNSTDKAPDSSKI